MTEHPTNKQMLEEILEMMREQPSSNDYKDLVNRVDNVVKTLEKITKTVYGNGDIGLTEEVRLLQKKIGWIDKGIWAGLAVFIVAIAESLYNWIVTLFK